MQCPVDGTNLVITDRQGVEIDYCPQCRGVWLDRGELDKVIDRMNGAYGQASHGQAPQFSQQQPERGHHDTQSRPAQYERRDYDDDDDYHGRQDGHHGRKHKKEGFLGDLFDF